VRVTRRCAGQTCPVHFDVGELAGVIDATVVGPARSVDGVTQDSRTLVPGMLFVPLVSARDGHEFIARAVANGAPAYLTERGSDPSLGATALVVSSTARALREIGVLARRRITGHVVAITGSVGKTSTKDLCAAAFAAHWRTHASEKSFNNEIGVPLTLANTPDDAEAVVLEMGARGIGHIAELCAIASPRTAIVTTVAAAHLELFGDIEAVARTKGEIVEALPVDGLAVLNADDVRVYAMRHRTSAKVLTYGRKGDVRSREVTLDAELRPRFTVETPWGSALVHLGARGAHNVMNALAAITAAVGCGAPLDAVADALARPRLSPWRMELGRTTNGAVVLNDAYNANPVSMRAALDALVALAATRRMAVLGPMAELGTGAADAHRVIGEYAGSLGIEVISVGVEHYGGTLVAGIHEALALLAGRDLGAGDAVLVKASRVGGLERVAAALLAV
jgi:UDP-N-acetylmuramoyl-tripeptide--D-alanyl-D-alanine ligase